MVAMGSFLLLVFFVVLRRLEVLPSLGVNHVSWTPSTISDLRVRQRHPILPFNQWCKQHKRGRTLTCTMGAV